MAALLLLEDTLNIYCNIYRLKSNSHFRAIIYYILCLVDLICMDLLRLIADCSGKFSKLILQLIFFLRTPIVTLFTLRNEKSLSLILLSGEYLSLFPGGKLYLEYAGVQV